MNTSAVTAENRPPIPHEISAAGPAVPAL